LRYHPNAGVLTSAAVDRFHHAALAQQLVAKDIFKSFLINLFEKNSRTAVAAFLRRAGYREILCPSLRIGRTILSLHSTGLRRRHVSYSSHAIRRRALASVSSFPRGNGPYRRRLIAQDKLLTS